MDVAKWLLFLGEQAGCLGENEREIKPAGSRVELLTALFNQ